MRALISSHSVPWIVFSRGLVWKTEILLFIFVPWQVEASHLAAKASRIECSEIFESLRYRLLRVIIGVRNKIRGVFFQRQRPWRSDCTHVPYEL